MERTNSAAVFAQENNPLGMAGALGAVDALNTLLLDLENRRK